VDVMDDDLIPPRIWTVKKETATEFSRIDSVFVVAVGNTSVLLWLTTCAKQMKPACIAYWFVFFPNPLFFVLFCGGQSHSDRTPCDQDQFLVPYFLWQLGKQRNVALWFFCSVAFRTNIRQMQHKRCKGFTKCFNSWFLLEIDEQFLDDFIVTLTLALRHANLSFDTEALPMRYLADSVAWPHRYELLDHHNGSQWVTEGWAFGG
jgi:hypothetical protein